MKAARPISDERVLLLRRVLDEVRAREDLRARRDADPVAFVHRQAAAEDQELVALVAACLAFGNVKAIRLKLTELLDRIGGPPSKAADDPRALLQRLDSFRHRVYRGEDIAKLLVGARSVQRAAGSLGAAFRAELDAVDAGGAPSGEALREALARFCDRIRKAGALGEGTDRRGPGHLLPDPRAGSGSKRLLLFLRWMIRPADGIDLGLWDVPTSRLVVPVDVHIHKLARNLGLTARNGVTWRTAVEITDALARLDASDPIRYDFSLCHLGMLQRCPSKRDEKRCEGCGVKPVCRHWAAKAAHETKSAAKAAHGTKTARTPKKVRRSA